MNRRLFMNRYFQTLAVILCLIIAGLTVIGFFASNEANAAVASHVVISEIYGGGGNSGATWTNDYIELYNPTSSAVSLSGWSVQYASATGTFGSNNTNLSGSIPAHGYYLIQEAAGTGGTTSLPSPNATGSVSMSATAGKVALAKTTSAISGPTDSNVVDFIGYGSTANQYEGSGAAPAPSNTTSVERKDNNGGTVDGQGNGWDTNSNSSDLVATSNINPQNSSSQLEPPLSTPTPTSTATPAATPTRTATSTATATRTATSIATPTSTATPSGVDNDNMGLGNPSGATTDTSNSNNYLMIKPQYDLSYNNSRHEPNWTSWHLYSADLGSTARQDDFRPDTTLPSGWYQVVATEFSGSGFDRGHMCPSGDRTSSVANNSATFLMTNMIPQAPNNNQVTWVDVENYCRTLVSAGNELYIISGGYGSGGTGSSGYMTTVGNGVVVPSNTWKIIVVLPNGNNDISRITTSTRVIAVWMPNTQTCSSQSWGYYRVSVDYIESMTGYNFLSLVPASIQNVIEASVDNGPTS